MSRGIDGRLMDTGRATVALDSQGVGYANVLFCETFLRPPRVTVLGSEADIAAGATYGTDGITKDGFQLTVSGSQIVSGDVRVSWTAHEYD